MNYYRRFPADYANDTRHLTLAEHGAYTILLDRCYATEKPLPDDRQKIYRLACANTDEERTAIDTVLREFFVLGTRGYTQARVQREIRHCSEKSKAYSVNGRKGGLSRKAIAKQSPSEPQASQTLDSRLYTLDSIPESKATPHFVRPDWISEESWSSFEEMRKKIRAPMTDRARSGIVRELEKLRSLNDPNEVLLQSVTLCWRGVFELRNGGNGNGSGRGMESFDERRQKHNQEVIARVAAKYTQ